MARCLDADWLAGLPGGGSEVSAAIEMLPPKNSYFDVVSSVSIGFMCFLVISENFIHLRGRGVDGPFEILP